MEENPQVTLLSLNVDYDSGNIVKEIARWTKFISIVGIIGVVLLLLAFVFADSMITALYAQIMPGMEALVGVFIFTVLLVLAIVGFMVFLLYRFSTLVKKGIETQDQQAFNSGLSSLRIYFIISGVFAILSLLSNLSGLFKL